MAHWLDVVVTLLEAETYDLRELARIAGGDEKTFYHGVRIANLDLSKQDLRGFGFTGFAGARLTKIRTTPTREERIALVIDCVIFDRKEGAQLLNEFADDRSVHLMSIVRYLPRLLEKAPSANEQAKFARFVDDRDTHIDKVEKIQNVVLVNYVLSQFNKAMAIQRHHMFYNIVIHTSKYREVKNYLTNRYLRENSRYATVHRSAKHYNFHPEIEQYLGCSRSAVRNSSE